MKVKNVTKPKYVTFLEEGNLDNKFGVLLDAFGPLPRVGEGFQFETENEDGVDWVTAIIGTVIEVIHNFASDSILIEYRELS